MSPSCILAHRGLWNRPEEKNSREALASAMGRGFGVETDVRDCDSELVVSHDPPRKGGLTLRQLLDDYRRLRASGMLAFNIKADGLGAELLRLLQAFEVTKYFVFDMSVPDMLQYGRLGLPFFSRRSEIESEIVASDACAGIWLDAFFSDWYKPQTIADMLAAGKKVAVVSPELHGRERSAVWQTLRQVADPAGRLLCCTDHPDELQKWMS
jgi:glycerophosphoryl diester phosphodiesterase